MKNQSILLLIGIVMLASCTGNFGVMKRRYSKGFYVSVTRDKRSTPADQKQTAFNSVKPKKEAVEVVRVEATTPKPAAVTVPSEVKPVSHIKPSSKQNRSSALYASSHQPEHPVFKPKDLSREVSDRGVVQGAKGNANAIVLIILCILLPPLAVYLYHDAINMDFWLSLILTILFWVPGVVWAFLVCFAGVSIAK